MDTERIIVFDTSLRDGEQAAGCRLGAKEKLEIARQLQKLNVDVIEAGFPISSPEDFNSVKLIAEEIDGPTIAALSRIVPKDIEACGRALANAKKGRIHTGVGVSNIHIEKKIRKSKEDVLKLSCEAIKLARTFVNDVEFYAEDASRADYSYLKDIIKAVIESGATVINIPDTTGYAIPELFGELIRKIKNDISELKENKVTLSVHCHNDLGLSVANTLSALKNGARQFEGTMIGVGERAGNTPLEEVILALHTRKDYFNLKSQINLKEINNTCQLVSRCLGIMIAHNKPIIGSNAFAHSSGIHVDGVLKDRETYEILNPEDIGMSKTKIVLTARTGRHGLDHRLKELGYNLTKEELDVYYEKFLIMADKKTEIGDTDLKALMENMIEEDVETYKLSNLQIFSTSDGIHAAVVKIYNQITKKEFIGKSWGDGAVNAAFKSVNDALNKNFELKEYNLKSIGTGSDAVGEVTVKVSVEQQTTIGHGNSTDVIEASVKGYINSINKMKLI